MEAKGFLYSTPFQTDPVFHPASCTTGNGDLPRSSSGQDVALTKNAKVAQQLRIFTVQ
jgi:hypothetical protein